MTTKTVHIIFTESAGGSLKFALRGNPGETVLALPDDLSLGPISPYDLEYRTKYFESLFAEMEDEAAYMTQSPEAEMFWNRVKDFWKQVSETEAEKIVWFTRRSVIEYTGFLELLSREKNPSELLVVDLTEGLDVVHENGITERIVPISLGELRPEWLLSRKNKARRLTKEELAYYLRRWEELKKDNMPLRTLWRGQLYSESPDIFDEKILESVPETWASAARVVGEMLGKLSEEYHLAGDMFLYSRLLELAKAGLVETEGERRAMRFLKVRKIQGSSH
ncbi:hypothetical protein EO95_18585 [Methanosarcina sp. 1.H.T.1A.1]|uniref:DUF3658 domain-containing protein n=1 Tax=Methanosarcina sp. 1.H.T.1A.1 TaxID=1483602 RepID=UPI0006224AAE|nr:DUF3658 domain-containing protein [Methanosarcina sp. 1.H.T.1A.1]KKH94692.1 hypothetical protein EO95_18585 [Methanosarcina sp. 1.H.T.1A.1]